jgi:hypothetical protein
MSMHNKFCNYIIIADDLKRREAEEVCKTFKRMTMSREDGRKMKSEADQLRRALERIVKIAEDRQTPQSNSWEILERDNAIIRSIADIAQKALEVKPKDPSQPPFNPHLHR